MMSSVSVSSNQASQAVGRRQGPPPPPPKSSSDETQASGSAKMEAALTETAEAVGLSEEELTRLKEAIQAAIDELGEDADPKSIGDAVSELVSEYGIDPEAFREALGDPPQRSHGAQGSAFGYETTSGFSANETGQSIFNNLYALDLVA